MGKEIFETLKRYPAMQNGPIRLEEYMVFKNAVEMNRSLVMRFYNQASIAIKSIDFELIQFDINGERLHKGTYVFDDVDAEAYSHFIPFRKIKLHESCTQIEYRLLTAGSEDDTWRDGVWASETIKEPPRQKEPSLSVTAIRHKRLPFPYVISLVIVIVYIVAVIQVFNAINY
ncbi:MAG: hypothetical protein ACOCU0_03765 [Bacillota bacterium]